MPELRFFGHPASQKKLNKKWYKKWYRPQIGINEHYSSFRKKLAITQLQRWKKKKKFLASEHSNAKQIKKITFFNFKK